VGWLSQIYYASEEFGTDDIRTSGGYFHMAEVFQQQDNTTIARSLYRQVRLVCLSSRVDDVTSGTFL